MAPLSRAVAFGAQNLVKDYFTGFMILLEDQYAVKDVVRINGIAGQVEKITLRLTVLRDLSGTLHFVPHGTVTTVSNMTHGFSRAEFDVAVAHKEDVRPGAQGAEEVGGQVGGQHGRLVEEHPPVRQRVARVVHESPPAAVVPRPVDAEELVDRRCPERGGRIHLPQGLGDPHGRLARRCAYSQVLGRESRRERRGAEE